MLESGAPEVFPSSPHFRAPKGRPAAVTRLVRPPTFKDSRPMTVAQKQGLRFEKKAQEHLKDVLPEACLEFGVWWAFRDAGQWRACQTDALFINDLEKIVTIFEIKRNHTADAWWQLEKLYKPIVEDSFPGWHVNIAEVCRTFDRATVMPAGFERIEDLKTWCFHAHRVMGVYRCPR